MEFDDIYDRYNKFVFYSCRKFTNDDDLALDAMQEVFIRLYEAIDTIRDKDKIKSWLYICAKNTSLNMVRSVRRIHIHESSADADIPDSSRGMDEAYIQRETASFVENAIGGMDIKYETILRMKYILEYTPKDIAKALKLPQATVYTRLRRGEMLLKKILREYEAHSEEGSK